jgi:hypothetical protein
VIETKSRQNSHQKTFHMHRSFFGSSLGFIEPFYPIFGFMPIAWKVCRCLCRARGWAIWHQPLSVVRDQYAAPPRRWVSLPQ